jgi:aspartyl-tRNA(Asn)/glutamyl-tRNA(Gln) amidotransferase subunit A
MIIAACFREPEEERTIPRVVTDPCLASAHDLSREIAARRLSPVDVVDALLARIAKHDPKLHAFVEVYAKEARAAAVAAEKAIRSGQALGPFHGVPIAIKDIIDIEGRVTTGGSASRLNHVATTTATVVRRALAQGMIVLGKTHTVEFACGAWGTNQHMGTPWNPWDAKVARTPGGSSSGSGVAVAARLAPWALGTDTGCSVRQPASWCGITGLKTTIGRISTHGILPLSPTLDTPGTMARTVRDVAALYNLLQGSDALDPITQRHPPDDPMPTLEDGVRGMKLARLPVADRQGVAAEVLDAYDRSLEALAALGADIVDIDLPFRLADFVGMSNITMAEGYFANAAALENPDAKLDDVVRKRLLAGKSITAHDYLATARRREEMKRQKDAAMKGLHAFLTPSTETAALALDSVDLSQAPVRFGRFVNILDMCALALPNGFTDEGMPTSLQIVCRGYEEAIALRIGHAYQRETDWHERVPGHWLDGDHFLGGGGGGAGDWASAPPPAWLI